MRKADLESALLNRGAQREGREEDAQATVRALFKPITEGTSRIPTKGLKQNPYNSRTVYTPDQVSARALSLLNSGQAQAILVAELPDGQRIVVDGWTRNLASIQLENDESLPQEKREFFSHIEAKVRTDLSMQDIAALSYIANEEHNSLTDIDRALGFHKALQDNLFSSQQELAEAFGIDQSVVSRLQGLATAPAPVREIILAHPSKLTYSFVAEVIGTGLSVELQSKLLSDVSVKDRSRSWLRNQVALASARTGVSQSKVQERQLVDATLKWPSSPRAKSLELVLRSKTDQTAAVGLLESVFSLDQGKREALAALLQDPDWVQAQLD